MLENLTKVIDAKGVSPLGNVANSFRHTTMVNHRGVVIALAMDANRQIHYTVLDLAGQAPGVAPTTSDPATPSALDSAAWAQSQPLPFAAELSQVGYSAAGSTTMPALAGDAFHATTARLSADAPFQALSDGRHVYLFRQAIAADHPDMVFAEYEEVVDGQRQVKKVPVVDRTLLVDRFVLVGTTLAVKTEIRFQRSRRRDRPLSGKDSLAARDLDGNPFFEPTQELALVGKLREGRFTVAIVPTALPDIERWQIFLDNEETGRIDAFSIERSADGLFNTRGSQYYVCPDSHEHVLETQPGPCPEDATHDLIPRISRDGFAERCLTFAGDAWVECGEIALAQRSFTIEAWVRRSIANVAAILAGHGSAAASRGLHIGFLADDTFRFGFYANDLTTTSKHSDNEWQHWACVYDHETRKRTIYRDGAAVAHDPHDAEITPYEGVGAFRIGAGPWAADRFRGEIDELRLWTRARTRPEIEAERHTRLVGNEPGLAGYWRLDEGEGDVAHDQTDAARHGVVHNAQWSASNAPIGDQPGIRRTSFGFAGRTIASGPTAVLYYQQEKVASGYGQEPKPFKKSARLLLAVATEGPPPSLPVSDGLFLHLNAEGYAGGDTWEDSSARGNHAIKSPQWTMPARHEVSGYRGRSFPVMRIGADTSVELTSLEPGKPFTVIIVDRYATSGSNHRGRTLQGRASGSNWLLGKHVGRNGYHAKGVWVGEPRDATVDRFSINTATLDTVGRARWYLDGDHLGTLSGAVAPGPLAIGRVGDYGGELSDADIAAILAWDRVLSEEERRAVEAWLADKYGVELPGARCPVSDGLFLHVGADGSLDADTWTDTSTLGNHGKRAASGRLPMTRSVVGAKGTTFWASRVSADTAVELAALKPGKPFTVMIVDRYVSEGPQRGRTLQGRDAGSNWLLGKHWGRNGFHAKGVWVGAPVSAEIDRFSINTATLDTDGLARWFLDGEHRGSLAGVVAPGPLAIGKNGEYANEVSDAEVATILAWDRVLSEEERMSVEAWLADRYDITLRRRAAGSGRRYIAALDFAIARDGRLAEVQDTIAPPAIERKTAAGLSEVELIAELGAEEEAELRLEQRLRDLKATVDTLDADLPALRADVRRGELEEENCRLYLAYGTTVALTARLRPDEAAHFFALPADPASRTIELATMTRDQVGAAEATHFTIEKHGDRAAEGIVKPGDKVVLRAAQRLSDLLGDPSAGDAPGLVKETEGTSFAWSAGGSGDRFYPGAAVGSWEAKQAATLVDLQNLATTRHIYEAGTQGEGKPTLNAAAAPYSSPNVWVVPLKPPAWLQDLSERVKVQRAALRSAETKLDQAIAERTLVEAKLSATRTRKARLSSALGGDVTLPMSLLHSDRFGLSVAGGLLGFAYTADTPLLFASASGKVGLYFRGRADDFFAAYYDTSAAKATYRIPSAPASGEGQILLVARHAGPELDQSAVRVVDATSGEAGECDVKIENITLGATEHWRNVAREPERMARTLSGRASRDPTSPFYYDYSQASAGSGGQSLSQGSRLFAALAGRSTADVPNAEVLASDETTPACQWTSDSAGRALSLSGGGCAEPAEAVDPRAFEVPGDLTLEAWVRPGRTHAPAALIHQRSDKRHNAGHYALELVPVATALTFSEDGSQALLTRTKIRAGESLSVEFWAKRTRGERLATVLRARAADQLNRQLFVRFDANGQLRFGFYANDLCTDSTHNDTDWHHWACVYDHTRATRSIYRDGELVATGPCPGSLAEDADLELGRGFESGFGGTLADLRLWSVARSGAQIRANLGRALPPGEVGLVGEWRGRAFEPAGLVEIVGNPAPAMAPVPAFNIRVSVGAGLCAQSRETIDAGVWSHLAAVFTQSYARAFDGKESRVVVPHSPTLNCGGDLSIEATIVVSDLNRFHGILSKGQVNRRVPSQAVPYNFYVDPTGRLGFSFDDKKGKTLTTHYLSKIGAELKADGLPHRVAVTRARLTTVKDDGTVTSSWRICFFIDGVDVGAYQDTCGDPGTGDQTIEIGGAYAGGQSLNDPWRRHRLAGVLADVRLWSVALARAQLGAALEGAEDGLLARWRLDDDGSVAVDEKGQRNGELIGAERVPDPRPSDIVLYRDGELVGFDHVAPASITDPGFSIGGARVGGALASFQGELDEIRVWSTPRTREQVQDSMFRRLVGERADLAAYYQFDATGERLADTSGRGRHLDLPAGAGAAALSTAPIGADAPQVRSALAGLRTDLSGRIECRPALREYADIQVDARGAMIGAMKRCYSYIVAGRWHLVTGFKVGDLTTEWVGQVQYAPQLIGFIEGAPPVPSENLTSTGLKNGEYADYGGASAISIVDAQKTTFNYESKSSVGVDGSFDLKVKLGAKSKTQSGQFVLSTVEETQTLTGLHLAADLSTDWGKSRKVGAGQGVTRGSSLALTGTWEDMGAIHNPYIGRRFIPANVGFALVRSETADLFALRLGPAGPVVSYTMRPNPDIPKDTNLLTFPINPRYSKQGTLDGRIGLLHPSDDVWTVCMDEDYAGGTSSGEYSYFKPSEAYRLKRAIERRAEALRTDYDWTTAGSVATAGLPTPPPRDIVNTYIWTADGGSYAESTETMDTREEEISASFDLKMMAGLTSATECFAFKIGFSIELDIMVGYHIHFESSKSVASESSFQLDVELSGERDIVEYDADGPVYEKGRPRRQPGKVDAYRFMSFYLRPSLENFDKFISTVVDPTWLRESPDANAAALRQAVGAQASAADDKKSKPWRVFHRVTFVSRVLADAQGEGAGVRSTEDRLRAADIGSNYELVRRLEPFVIDHKDEGYGPFCDAVRAAVRRYLGAEMRPATEDIVAYLCQYYGVYADA